MLKSSIAIAALMIGAPMAFAQSAPGTDKGGASAGMSDRSSHERSPATSGASEGAAGFNSSPGREGSRGSAAGHAPGQMKGERSVRDHAPGVDKSKPEKQSENRSMERDHDSAKSNQSDRVERSSDGNAERGRTSDRPNRNATTTDRNGRNEHAGRRPGQRLRRADLCLGLVERRASLHGHNATKCHLVT